MDLLTLALAKKGGGASSWNDLTDKPFGKMFVEVLPTTQVEVVDATEIGLPSLYGGAVALTKNAGDGAYKVTMNGATYEGTATTIIIEEASMVFLGNVAWINDMLGAQYEDSGEPFLMSCDGSLFLANTDAVTLSVLSETIEPIPVDYLPDLEKIVFEANEQYLFAPLNDEQIKILERASKLGRVRVCATITQSDGNLHNVTVTMAISRDDDIGYNLYGFYFYSTSGNNTTVNMLAINCRLLDVGWRAYYAFMKLS